jgi:hypothetical protein
LVAQVYIENEALNYSLSSFMNHGAGDKRKDAKIVYKANVIIRRRRRRRRGGAWKEATKQRILL